MTKKGFRNLFLQALKAAAEAARINVAKAAAHSFLIELHAPGSPDRLVSVDEAVDQIYLGSDRFYRIIDVAIRRVQSGNPVAFVRVSGHSPGAFSQTWDPANLGPFKQIYAETIEDRGVLAG